jgi:hypothetical protein
MAFTINIFDDIWHVTDDELTALVRVTAGGQCLVDRAVVGFAARTSRRPVALGQPTPCIVSHPFISSSFAPIRTIKFTRFR